MLLVRAPIIVDDGTVSILSKTLVIGRRAVVDEFDECDDELSQFDVASKRFIIIRSDSDASALSN